MSAGVGVRVVAWAPFRVTGCRDVDGDVEHLAAVQLGDPGRDRQQLLAGTGRRALDEVVRQPGDLGLVDGGGTHQEASATWRSSQSRRSATRISRLAPYWANGSSPAAISS